MGFVKVQKNNAYFKRYQVKYRRRREGKTDFVQRRLLINQDKNKYQTPKYRFIARITNRGVICQIASAELKGDRIHASAYSRDLQQYGLKVGLSNYCAAYATGLLCARRILTLKGLEKKYPGLDEVSGDSFELKVDSERRPFRALLDVGLANTTVGNKVFACLKGAVDGGLDIPHSDKRFPGYSKDDGKLDAEAHRARILGEHVSEWMEQMEDEDKEKFQGHFAVYLKQGIKADDLEDMYLDLHKAIRADPKAKDPTKAAADRKKNQVKARSYKLKANTAYTYAQRKHRSLQKLNAIRRGLGLEPKQK